MIPADVAACVDDLVTRVISDAAGSRDALIGMDAFKQMQRGVRGRKRKGCSNHSTIQVRTLVLHSLLLLM